MAGGDLNYYATLIAIADDCPVEHGVEPTGTRTGKTVAVLQYEMLDGHPFEYTQEDVLFEVWRSRNRPDATGAEAAELRRAFLATPQACLRASPLPKKYGFGLLFDGEGRVALCPADSTAYREAMADPGVTTRKAMRSRRA